MIWVLGATLIISVSLNFKPKAADDRSFTSINSSSSLNEDKNRVPTFVRESTYVARSS